MEPTRQEGNSSMKVQIPWNSNPLVRGSSGLDTTIPNSSCKGSEIENP